MMNTDPFRDEVFALHDFLNAWLTGRQAKGDGRPKRLEAVLADDFTVIHPDGGSGGKSDAVNSFAEAWGEKPPTYALRVADVQTRMLGADYCLATYSEWHEGEPGRGRISTALLQRSEANGTIRWLFLQETPAPQVEPGLRSHAGSEAQAALPSTQPDPEYC